MPPEWQQAQGKAEEGQKQMETFHFHMDARYDGVYLDRHLQKMSGHFLPRIKDNAVSAIIAVLVC